MLNHRQITYLRLTVVILLTVAATPAAGQTSDTLTLDNISQTENKKNIRPNSTDEEQRFVLIKVENYKKALLTSPDDALLYNNLGVAYFQANDYQTAVTVLEKAIALKPDFATAFYNLSIAYDQLERYSEALTAVKQAVALDSNNSKSRFQMCILLMIAENAQEAIPCYETLMKMEPTDIRAKGDYSIALAMANQFEKGFNWLEENLARYPDEPVLHNSLGMLYFRKKKYKQAQDSFTQAIKLRSDYVTARFNLAIVQMIRNDRSSALEQYTFLKNSNPNVAASLYNFIYRDKVVSVKDR